MSRQEIMAELREWKQMLEEGLVTQEQFSDHQKVLLAQLKAHSVLGDSGVSPREELPKEEIRESLKSSEHGLTAGTSRPLSLYPDAVEIYCPPGTFRMGANPGDQHANRNEKPAREVTLNRGFWALSTLVTQAMYEEFMGENPSMFVGPRNPVEGVTIYNAAFFCNRLSVKAGLAPAYRVTAPENGWFSSTPGTLEWFQDSDGFRLPTEAEWEYLARAGSNDVFYGKLDDIAWYHKNSDDEAHPVMEKAPNAWGFYDTLGNVNEWCIDLWSENAYSELPEIDPSITAEGGEMYVQRGGMWDDSMADLRVSSRQYGFGDSDGDQVGIRVVRNHKS